MHNFLVPEALEKVQKYCVFQKSRRSVTSKIFSYTEQYYKFFVLLAAPIIIKHVTNVF